jgi:hypothetical protein
MSIGTAHYITIAIHDCIVHVQIVCETHPEAKQDQATRHAK